MRRSPSTVGRLAIVPLAFAAWLAATGSAAAWSYKEAAEPYAGSTIHVLDEVTPLQEEFAKMVPDFVAETGIKVEYELLNHFEVINRGHADLLSGRGEYDAILLHSAQMGLLLDADALRPFDDLIANSKLTSPDLDLADLIEPSWSTAAKQGGKTYGFLDWAYNTVYWARGDLIGNPEEKAAFKAKYGYELAPAQTMQQMRDIAEFFTRKKGEKLAGQTLESDFYGILLEGIKGGTIVPTMWNCFIKNWGGNLFDAKGRPNLDTPENLAALTFWVDLWKFGPPGMAETSFIDVTTLMGQGVAAQTVAWSDFALGVDRTGGSKYAGKFVYGQVPANTDYKGSRTAETEPSILIISKYSKNAEPTYLFLQWMIEKQTQAKLAERLGGGVPIRKSLLELPVYKDAALAPLYRAMVASLQSGEAKPRVPKIYEIYDVLGAAFQEAGLGKITPKQALEQGQQALLGICDTCTLQ